MSTSTPLQDNITEIINLIGPHHTQRVLEILGADRMFTTVTLPPSRMLNGIMYRIERNKEMGLSCKQ